MTDDKRKFDPNLSSEFSGVIFRMDKARDKILEAWRMLCSAQDDLSKKDAEIINLNILMRMLSNIVLGGLIDFKHFEITRKGND